MSKKTFKTLKNEALGASKLKKLNIGDLVRWKSWNYEHEDPAIEESHGMIMDIFVSNKPTGKVYMAKILVFGASEEVFLPLILLYKN